MSLSKAEILLLAKERQKAHANGENPSLQQLLERIQQRTESTPSTTEEVT